MIQIIDQDMINSVRTVLGMTQAELPDSTIQDPTIGEQAEAEVLGWVGPPRYAERSMEEQDKIRRGIVLLTASYVVGTFRRSNALTSERYSQQFSYQRQAVDLDGWAQELRDRAWAAVEGLRDGLTGGLEYFGVASGRRGA